LTTRSKWGQLCPTSHYCLAVEGQAFRMPPARLRGGEFNCRDGESTPSRLGWMLQREGDELTVSGQARGRCGEQADAAPGE
jgi:hypothetical protein